MNNLYTKLRLLVLFVLTIQITTFGQEICNNGIDDDGDGQIDCDDPDCKNVGTANDINNEN